MLRSLTATLRRQILVLTALLVCSLPLVTTRIYASDEVQYYSYLRSLWFDRDVSFDNEYQYFYDAGTTHYQGFHETFLEGTTVTGRRVSFATIGPALLWSPFYAAGDVIVHLRRAVGDPVAADGYSPPYIASVCYGSAVYGWLSLVLSLVIVRRLFGPSAAERSGAIALVATLAIWFGTPLFFYMYVAPPMAHACSAFTVAAFVLTWLHVRGRWSPSGMIALGALAALMAMVREQDIFIAIGPAVDWALDMWHARGTSHRTPAGPSTSRGTLAGQSASRASLAARGALGAIAFGIAYLPQLAAYLAINGHPGPSHLVARKLNWLAPHALGVLLSPEHGLLLWTPLVALSIAGLIWLALQPGRLDPSATSVSTSASASSVPGPASNGRRVAICLLLMLISQVYIAGSVESWTVAGAFGQRRFVGLTALFVVGLAALLTRLTAPSARDSARQGPRDAKQAAHGSRVLPLAAAAAIVIGVWWNVGLMAQFGAGLMDRQRLELGRNTYQTFVTIPKRLPELAYRYLFQRQSFYKTEPPRQP
jgi:hypothetical protein